MAWNLAVSAVDLSQISSNPIATGAGAVTNGVQRITWGNDSPGVDSASNRLNVCEKVPIPQQYATSRPYHVEAGAAIDGTYTEEISMNGYADASIQLKHVGTGTVVLTVLGSVQDDGAAIGALEYHDITLEVFNVASLTSSDVLVDNTGKLGGFSAIQIKVVIAGKAADTAYSVWVKRRPL